MACNYYDLYIDSNDINNAVNNNAYPDYTVYVSYYDCDGNLQVTTYGSSGTFTNAFCSDTSYGVITLYYYNTDQYYTAINSNTTVAGNCGTPTPTPDVTSTPTPTPPYGCFSLTYQSSNTVTNYCGGNAYNDVTETWRISYVNGVVNQNVNVIWEYELVDPCNGTSYQTGTGTILQGNSYVDVYLNSQSKTDCPPDPTCFNLYRNMLGVISADTSCSTLATTPTPTATPAVTPTQTPTPNVTPSVTTTPTPTNNTSIWLGTSSNYGDSSTACANYATVRSFYANPGNNWGLVSYFTKFYEDGTLTTVVNGGGRWYGMTRQGDPNNIYAVQIDTDGYVMNYTSCPTPTPQPTQTRTPDATPAVTPAVTSTQTRTPTATPTATPFTQYTSATTCNTLIQSSAWAGSGGRGIFTVTIDVGVGTGNLTLTYDAISVPDKFEVFWNGSTVIDTGFRGSSSYNSALNALGYPNVSGPGSGTASFNKTTQSPGTITIVITAPLTGTLWSCTLSCPSDPTPTPTPTTTTTLTATPTQTPTTTTTLTATPTQTPTTTTTLTATPTQTPTTTTTLTATPTQTPTTTTTLTATPTQTPTTTTTTTLTATPTQTSTPAVTPTQTNTPSNSPTPSITASPTLTPTQTNTPSNSPTPSITASQTATPTQTNTPSNSPTPSITASQTATPTQTNTPSNSPTPPVTPTQTSTPTQTNTPSNSPTPSITASQTTTPTQTNTPSNSPTPAVTATQTSTPTQTNTPSNSPTPAVTSTQTSTPTQTNTPSNSPTPSITASQTPTPTQTNTPSNSPTPAVTATQTSTPTQTNTPSNSPTPDVTATQTSTPTQTNTPSNSPTPSITASPTVTPTQTNTPSNSPTPEITSTQTPTTTTTLTATPTQTPTTTTTLTATPTQTPTTTTTLTSTPAQTTATQTATPAVTPSPTPTNHPVEFAENGFFYEPSSGNLYATTNQTIRVTFSGASVGVNFLNPTQFIFTAAIAERGLKFIGLQSGNSNFSLASDEDGNIYKVNVPAASINPTSFNSATGGTVSNNTISFSGNGVTTTLNIPDVYTNNGTISSNRVVSVGANSITFGGSGASVFKIVDTTGNPLETGKLSGVNFYVDYQGGVYATSKSFWINNPNKSGYKLRHGSLEGPENGVYFRGKTGLNKIEIPQEWTWLVDFDSITVSLTSTCGDELYIESITDLWIKVGGVNCEYFYVVNAERKDIDDLRIDLIG